MTSGIKVNFNLEVSGDTIRDILKEEKCPEKDDTSYVDNFHSIVFKIFCELARMIVEKERGAVLSFLQHSSSYDCRREDGTFDPIKFYALLVNYFCKNKTNEVSLPTANDNLKDKEKEDKKPEKEDKKPEKEDKKPEGPVPSLASLIQSSMGTSQMDPSSQVFMNNVSDIISENYTTGGVMDMGQVMNIMNQTLSCFGGQSSNHSTPSSAPHSPSPSPCPSSLSSNDDDVNDVLKEMQSGEPPYKD